MLLDQYVHQYVHWLHHPLIAIIGRQIVRKDKEMKELKTIQKEELDAKLDNHELWLETKGEEGKRLDLQHMALQGTDFSNRDLKRARFFYSDLTSASFRNTNLRWSNFTDTKLEGADFTDATLSNVYVG